MISSVTVFSHTFSYDRTVVLLTDLKRLHDVIAVVVLKCLLKLVFSSLI